MSTNSKQPQGLIAVLQQAAAQASALNGTQKPTTLPAAAPQAPVTLPAAALQTPTTLPANVSQIPGDFPPKTPIGMCYVPFQQWETPLAENIGFEAGTIFPSLVLPFSTVRGCAVQ
ncbi:MAG: spore coat associated protein CotJA [Ruminococcus sp.]|jgi:hypothetical protein|nr:spore coat associated protein CotJA [Ruminococcus sp.]